MVLRDRNRLEKSIEQVRAIEQELDDAAMLIELGEAEDDIEVVAEAEATIAALQGRSEKLELESLLSGQVDGNAISKLMPGRGERNLKTGQKCWLGCISAGLKAMTIRLIG